MMNEKRLLLVHAHPDDETINNGATMAMYAKSGVGVTLVLVLAEKKAKYLFLPSHT